MRTEPRINEPVCGWCGRRAKPPEGVFLSRPDVARGRTICTGCGRFQNACECGR